MPAHGGVVVIDLEHHALTGGVERRKVVLAVRVVVRGEAVEALYGGFDREPFTDESREYVFVTRLRPNVKKLE